MTYARSNNRKTAADALHDENEPDKMKNEPEKYRPAATAAEMKTTLAKMKNEPKKCFLSDLPNYSRNNRLPTSKGEAKEKIRFEHELKTAATSQVRAPLAGHLHPRCTLTNLTLSLMLASHYDSDAQLSDAVLSGSLRSSVDLPPLRMLSCLVNRTSPSSLNHE